MADIAAISRKVVALRAAHAGRDARMKEVAAVRRGESHEAFPGIFSDTWSKPIVANFIDSAARDLAELLAPLPSFSCTTGNIVEDAARRRADKRTRIVNHYVMHSRLAAAMFNGADYFFTYGFTPVLIEPDFEAKLPRFTVEDPMGAYPEMDRFGRVVSYTKVFSKTIRELCSMFPEYADQIRSNPNAFSPAAQPDSETKLDLVRFMDRDVQVLFLPERHNLVVAEAKNPTDEVMVEVIVRPSLDGQMRGQFDDVLWVQLARAKFALLSLEAVQKSVQAPIVVPMDVNVVPLGGDALIHTNSPEGVGRVRLEVPNSAFAESQILDNEMRTGSRYPEARSGNVDASIITGRGVEALMGGFDTQIKAAQELWGVGLTAACRKALKLDEALWPHEKKSITGVSDGVPYDVTYRPADDIKGNYVVDVAYGLMAGLDPNRALVWGLQARGDKLISRQFLRRNLPANMNPSQEEQMIDIEDLRDGLKQAVQGYVQAIPVLAEQGGDPSEPITKIAAIIQGRKKGENIEDVIAAAFAPQAPPPGAGAPGSEQPPLPGAPGQAASPGGGDIPLGMQPDGLLRGVAQAGQAPGGRPDLRTLIAGLTGSGRPNLSARVERRQPI